MVIIDRAFDGRSDTNSVRAYAYSFPDGNGGRGESG
jgi:hypothetical protein